MDLTQRRISRIARMVRTFTNRSMRREGVGPSELEVLLTIRFHPGITLTEVCRHLELDKGAAARQVASLQAKGYVRREPNPNDRRSHLLYATEKGEAIRSSKTHVEEVFYEWLVEPLSEEEREELARLLEILVRRCREERDAEFPHVSRLLEAGREAAGPDGKPEA